MRRLLNLKRLAHDNPVHLVAMVVRLATSFRWDTDENHTRNSWHNPNTYRESR